MRMDDAGFSHCEYIHTLRLTSKLVDLRVGYATSPSLCDDEFEATPQ